MRQGMHAEPMAGAKSGGGFGVALADCCYTDSQILLSHFAGIK